MGIKKGVWSGQRRIFFLLDRATKKFYGDVRLWIQYADYAKQQKAHHKTSQVLTSMLRLHPAKPELWVYAASYAYENQGDMTEARSYMQRGLRFCKTSMDLWIEYGRLEMMYIAKIAARQRILGLDKSGSAEKTVAGNELDADHIAIPNLIADGINPDLGTEEPTTEQSSLKLLTATPVLSGDIPVAIFDAAMSQFKGSELFGERFFEMTCEFDSLQALPKVHSHIAGKLQDILPESSIAMSCQVRLPLSGISYASPRFKDALAQALERLNLFLRSPTNIASATPNSDPMLRLCIKTIPWLLSYLEHEDLEENVAKAIAITTRKVAEQYRGIVLASGKDLGDETARLVEDCTARGFTTLGSSILHWALEIWPSNSKLQNLQASASGEVTQVE